MAILLFGCPKNHFRSHFWTFQINTKLFFLIFTKWPPAPFWMSEIHFWSHFWPFQINTQLYFFSKFVFLWFFTKWLPVAILNVRKSLSVAILAISDQYKTFILCIFTKWPPAPILDVRNSLSSGFLAISDQYATLFYFFILCDFFYKMAAGGHFGCPKITFGRISDHFRLIWNFFLNYITKWLPSAILDRTTMSIIELVRYIWMSNGFVKFEECSLNPSKVIALTTKLWRGGGPRGGCVADENIIFPETYVSREYNYNACNYCICGCIRKST